VIADFSQLLRKKYLFNKPKEGLRQAQEFTLIRTYKGKFLRIGWPQSWSVWRRWDGYVRVLLGKDFEALNQFAKFREPLMRGHHKMVNRLEHDGCMMNS